MTSFLSRQLGHPEGLFGSLLLRLLNRVNAEMNRAVLADLPPVNGDRVLEIGFGGGDLMSSLLQMPIGHATGLEVSASALTAGRRRFGMQISEGRLTLVQASVEAMPFDAASFDRIYTCNTIYFWPDLDRALAEIARVLRPGGAVAIGHVRQPPAGTRHRSLDVLEAALGSAGYGQILSRPVRDAFTVTTAVRL